MNQEFISMFETLMEIIWCKCDPSKEWDTGTECTTIGDMWERADNLLAKAKKDAQ